MRALILVLAVLSALPAAAQTASDGRMTVTGEGVVASVPDMATVTVGVTRASASAAEALAGSSAAVESVLARLDEAGIAPRDLQTSDLSLSPIWSQQTGREGRQIDGYSASNTVRVRVRDLERLGAILAAVVDDGANEFRGLNFGLQEPGPALDEARRLAVAEARRKAALFAEAAGLMLGPILSLEEGGGGGPQPMMERSFVAAAPVPIAEGEVETRATVTLVYGTLPAE